MLDYLREAETLAEALDDQPRLGRVSAYMCRYFREMGDHDGAVASGQHALAVAETLGDFALQVMAKHYLGTAYHVLGDHRRAMELLRSNVESLAGDLIRERFGMTGLPAVLSRAWLARCLAELGAFPEGIAHGEEAVRIAEAVDHPNSLIYAYLGVGFLSLRKGDLSRAIPVLERCLESAGFITSGSGSPRPPRPWAVRMPVPAVSPRPCRCWSRRSRGVPRWGPWAVSRCGWAM